MEKRYYKNNHLILNVDELTRIKITDHMHSAAVHLGTIRDCHKDIMSAQALDSIQELIKRINNLIADVYTN